MTWTRDGKARVIDIISYYHLKGYTFEKIAVEISVDKDYQKKSGCIIANENKRTLPAILRLS